MSRYSTNIANPGGVLESCFERNVYVCMNGLHVYVCIYMYTCRVVSRTCESESSRLMYDIDSIVPITSRRALNQRVMRTRMFSARI